ncbi:uncharacterized protein [Triticum aestivum]|uniref:uncharacterized protein isoform X2 n=1 Tax=Triticum aestivum TaxID=4565 RepID=UPI001D006F26|nr:uncharacterized protein LOC123188300 isoform X2 [Triticum aestivum]
MVYMVIFSMGNIGLMFLFSMGNVGLKFVLYAEEESSACAHEQGEQRSRRSRCTWVHVQIDLVTNLELFLMQGRLVFIFSDELVADLEYFMQVRLKTDMEFFMQGSLKFVLYGKEEESACTHEQGEQVKR